MAHLHLMVSRELTHDERSRAAAELTRITAETLGRPVERISVLITTVPPGGWFIGGLPLAGRGSAYFLDVKVSQGTVVKAEKAWFLEAVAASMGRLLGEVALESCTAIHELAADAWGYAGLSCEFRYITANGP